jgi:UDP-glucuronate 4-epimerase
VGRYLLAGSAGFIGSRVAEFLIKDGHTVVGVDDMNDAYDVRLKNFRLEKLRGLENYLHFQENITSLPALERIADEAGPFEAVINLAARAGVRASVENPWVFVDTNVTGTLNLLEICRRRGIPKFVLASTSSIYGNDAPLPTPETACSDLPLQPYAATKKAAEALAHSYHYLYNLDVTVFRYFTVYGPAGRPDMVMFRFCQWISEGKPVHLNGDGEQTRGFTYVDDIARGTIRGLMPVGYEVINLGGHESISINDMIAILENYIGKKAEVVHHPFHPADMSANLANVEKAGRLLGWEPQVPLQEGIWRLVQWYMQERAWASQVLTP